MLLTNEKAELHNEVISLVEVIENAETLIN